MKKFLLFFFPSKNAWRMLFMMLPVILIGWWLFPVVPITYIQFLVVNLLVAIWFDIMEIRDKLDIK